MVDFKCPNCQAVLRGADGIAGRMCECPTCGISFTVPTQGASSRQEAAPAPQYRAERAMTVKIPNYGGVKFLGAVYTLLGWITCVVGGIIFLVVAVVTVAAIAQGEQPGREIVPGVFMGVVGLWWGAATVLVGLMQIGFGQLFYCIRDMAQNSFYLQR